MDKSSNKTQAEHVLNNTHRSSAKEQIDIHDGENTGQLNQKCQHTSKPFSAMSADHLLILKLAQVKIGLTSTVGNMKLNTATLNCVFGLEALKVCLISSTPKCGSVSTFKSFQSDLHH